MILSYKDSAANDLRKVSMSGRSRASSSRPNGGLPILNAAPSLDTLRALPGNRLEALKGDRAGQYSIRVNQQWRICFEWEDGQPGPSSVEIVDYH